NEFFFTADRPGTGNGQPWVCFDEIHKMPRWKNILKGIYDTSSERYNFIVTGSAKFNISRRAGDSLSGRFFTFHLFPLCLEEAAGGGRPFHHPPESAESFMNLKLESSPIKDEAVSSLLEYGGFPEPFTRQSKNFHAKWSRDYMDTVIKEDIGELTRIIDRENIYDLYRLLPEMAGSPISESSLASHLEISPPTVKNYLKCLEDFYLSFRIHPYTRNIKRSLLKASKCYLYDWTRVKDEGKRFENFIAVELKTLISFWSDATGDYYHLWYVRDKEKRETDFLITKDDTPWLLVETKHSDSPIEKHHFETQKMLKGIPLVQVTRKEGVCSLQSKNAYRISASRLLS
ncbi:MAG: AAA family ATPase, partial [Candidatus Omnitrophota bacterium]